MRPRGESISSPHDWYVGQVGRQKPQWTQVSMRRCSGKLEASDESSRVEPAVRVEAVLQLLHEPEAARNRSPRVDLGADVRRRLGDDERATGLDELGARALQRL